MRATEQIFNNASEESQIVYLGFLAGLIPSAAGFSHQAVTDVGIMSSIPGMRIFEPSGPEEFQWCVDQALAHKGPSYIRVGAVAAVGRSGSAISRMDKIVGGEDVALVSSGPLLTQQALESRKLLEKRGLVAPAVFSAPEIARRFGKAELEELATFSHVVVLENHNPARAKYFYLGSQLDSAEVTVHRVGLDGLPANGQPAEVLASHLLDPDSIALRVAQLTGSHYGSLEVVQNASESYSDRESH